MTQPVPEVGQDSPCALTEPGNANEVRYIAYLCNAHPRTRPKRYIPYVATVYGGRAWAGRHSASAGGPGAARYIAYLCNAQPRTGPKRYIPYVATVYGTPCLGLVPFCRNQRRQRGALPIYGHHRSCPAWPGFTNRDHL